MNNIEYSRLVMKRTTFSGVTPTVNTGDTIDNSWSENDILNAELFYNLEDQKLYTRSGGDIVLLANGTTNLTGSTTCCPLEDVLSVGNTTGSNNILVDNNYGIYCTDEINNGIDFTDGEIRIKADDGVDNSYLQVTGGDVNLFTTGNLLINSDFYGVTSNNAGFIGINYATDYSANYTNRSLVDKEYVDGLSPFEEGSGTLSTQRKDVGLTTDGNYSFNTGFNNLIDTGSDYSSVIGYDNVVSGSSVATSVFGFNNTVDGMNYSFIAGSGNILDTATGYSGIIGRENTVSNNYCFSSGYQNQVTAPYGNGLGYQNIVSGTSAVAIGQNNVAGGSSSVAMGRDNTVNGLRAVGMGYLNTASSNQAFSMGYNNVSSGPYSVTFGNSNTADGNYSTCIGGLNQVITGSDGSMAVGYLNEINSMTYSFAAGYGNTIDTSTGYSVAFGRDNTNSTNYGVVGGYNNTLLSTANYSSVFGQANSIGGNYNFAVGYNNATSTAQSSIVMGYENICSGSFASILGGQDNTLSTQHSAIVGGFGNTGQTGSYHGVFVGSGNDVRGNSATIIGGQNNLNEGLQSSIIGGLDNSISSDASVILGGVDNVVTGGTYSGTLGGQLNTVSSNHSATIGGAENIVTGDRSVTIGGNGLPTNGKDDTVMVPELYVVGRAYINKQIYTETSTGNNPTANAFVYDGDQGMTQELDLQGSTATVSLTFSNQQEGATYTLIVIQGSNLDDMSFPTGYWLNDTAPFDFTTLADNDRAMVTATRLNSTWYFAVKSLTLV